jgi:hypothetical protein
MTPDRLGPKLQWDRFTLGGYLALEAKYTQERDAKKQAFE